MNKRRIVHITAIIVALAATASSAFATEICNGVEGVRVTYLSLTANALDSRVDPGDPFHANCDNDTSQTVFKDIHSNFLNQSQVAIWGLRPSSILPSAIIGREERLNMAQSSNSINSTPSCGL